MVHGQDRVHHKLMGKMRFIKITTGCMSLFYIWVSYRLDHFVRSIEMRTTFGFCRCQLDVRCPWFPYRGARHLYQPNTYAVSLEHPDVELCIQDSNENCAR